MFGEEWALHSSRAETATGFSREFSVREWLDAIFVLDVTAASGATPTLDVTIVTLDHVGAEEDIIATFAQKTGVAAEWIYNLDVDGLRTANATSKVVLKKLGNFIKVKWTIGGETPSFTFTVSAIFKK